MALQKLNNKYISQKIATLGYIPRWIVFSIDLFIVFFANILSYLIVSNLTLKYYDTASVFQRIIIILGAQAFFFFAYKTYSGIIRHTNLNDGVNVIKATISALISLSILNYTHFYIKGAKIFLMPALIITFVLSFIFLLFFRIIVKIIYQIYIDTSQSANLKNVVIYGTDSNAISLANALIVEVPKKYKLVGFLDNKKKNITKKIFGQPIIYHKNSIVEIFKNLEAKSLLIPDKTLNKSEKISIIEECIENQIELLTVPLISNWNNQKLISKKIKSFEIQDLLNREEIVIENEKISNQLHDKTVLITGAAGSIGSEIVRQVIQFQPQKIILVDIAETPLHQLLLELNAHKQLLYPEIIDVRNQIDVQNLFQKYLPQIIFHAAAYKHVPLMEKNPNQAVLTNVLGTENVANAALQNNAENFVFVSTDKAVNPSNIMGASKRIAEKLILSKAQKNTSSTKFIITRFGNVLGSNGSVVPLFTKQINEGGPVTITHPEIIRYFMTIPEACQLVLEAGVMGNGGEVFVFDMGKPVKIIDLAKKMIKLAGFEPEKDIKIEVVGLRPGEKLYEELLYDSAKNLPTHHQKIMIAQDSFADFITFEEQKENLYQLVYHQNKEELVKQMKKMIPEFISLNSEFTLLDT